MTAECVVLVGPSSGLISSLQGSDFEIYVLHEPQHYDWLEPYRADGVNTRVITSYGEVESTLSALASIPHPIRSVLPGNEASVVAAALAAAHVRASGQPVSTALACRDKALQKTLWWQHGVPCAKWQRLEQTTDASQFGDLMQAAGLSYPLVLKPSLQAGAAGVSVVCDPLEVSGGLESAIWPMIVEEFLDCDELHIDGIVSGGELQFISVSRYATPLWRAKHGVPIISTTVSPEEDLRLYGDARQLTASALSSLGLANGVFHFEAFEGPSGLIAGELACRPGGGFIPEVVKRTYGIDLWEQHWRIVSGQSSRFVPERTSECYGFVHLPTIPGMSNPFDATQLERHDFVKRVHLVSKLGEAMPSMADSSVSCLAYVLVEAGHRDELVTHIDDLVEETWLALGQR